MFKKFQLDDRVGVGCLVDSCRHWKIKEGSRVAVIPIQKINEAYERMIRSDVKYRFVIDIASLKNEKRPE